MPLEQKHLQLGSNVWEFELLEVRTRERMSLGPTNLHLGNKEGKCGMFEVCTRERVSLQSSPSKGDCEACSSSKVEGSGEGEGYPLLLDGEGTGVFLCRGREGKEEG